MTIQANVNLPADVNAADKGALMQVAQGIVEGNGSALDHWLDTLRQSVSISGTPFHQSHIDLPGMTARWGINHGYEKLELDIYPAIVGGAQSANNETNLDGYICWIHGDPGYPDLQGYPNPKPSSPGPYNLFLNGYLIATNYQPIGPVGGYPILFGRSALLCGSYVGDIERKNPLLKEQALKPANPIIPANGWGDYKDGTAPDGSDQPTIAKTLGYWIFDWTNIHNPCQFVSFSYGSSKYQQWATLFPNGVANLPVFDKGLYFKSAQPKNSPLLSMGKNAISVALSPSSPGSSEVTIVDVFIGEFYDRGKYRVVSQSWTLNAPPGGSISLNDCPLIYGSISLTNGFSNGSGMLFDLTPKYTSQDPTGDDSLLGPHTKMIYGGTGGYLAGLNDDQLVAYQAWEAQATTFFNNYQAGVVAQLATLDDQLTAAYPLYARAYKLAIIGRELLGNSQAFETYFPDYNTIYYNSATKQHINYSGSPQPEPDDTLITKTITTTTVHHNPDYSTTQSQYLYGPTQSWYLDLEYTLESYQAHVSPDDPGPQFIIGSYIITPGSSYDTVTGTGTDVIVETTGCEYQQATISDYAFLANADDYIGPTTYAGLLSQINVIVPRDAGNYLDIQQQINTLNTQKPPAGPPMPNLGDSFEIFKYSNITISGNAWSYKQ